ncbi:hypothetical protein FA13DRAFT_1723597 [Coprinellus micaceus]|uniref:Uncharacterized protein n=1 Tax=Coprinellus micaceus TaxID=71717 RepID=A0A4Y7U021_COPMI|nr:hypothetical protein FA13DRAFT_1723597 [Coprinellus micaceus]
MRVEGTWRQGSQLRCRRLPFSQNYCYHRHDCGMVCRLCRKPDGNAEGTWKPQKDGVGHRRVQTFNLVTNILKVLSRVISQIVFCANLKLESFVHESPPHDPLSGSRSTFL